MAVLELSNLDDMFSASIPLYTGEIALTQTLRVVGLQDGLTNPDGTDVYSCQIEVNVILSGGSSLIQTAYCARDGLSGAGVIIAEQDGAYAVVGVHVGAHDTTEVVPAVKKVKYGKSTAADADSVSEAHSSLSQSIHGHTAYCLVCVASRVQGLIDFVRGKESEKEGLGAGPQEI